MNEWSKNFYRAVIVLVFSVFDMRSGFVVYVPVFQYSEYFPDIYEEHNSRLNGA